MVSPPPPPPISWQHNRSLCYSIHHHRANGLNRLMSRHSPETWFYVCFPSSISLLRKATFRTLLLAHAQSWETCWANIFQLFFSSKSKFRRPTNRWKNIPGHGIEEGFPRVWEVVIQWKLASYIAARVISLENTAVRWCLYLYMILPPNFHPFSNKTHPARMRDVYVIGLIFL